MLKQRLLTVAIALPLFVGALFLLPAGYWAVLLLAPLAIAAWEWARLIKLDQRLVYAYVIAICGAAIALWLIVAQAETAAAAHTLRVVPAWVSVAFWSTIVPWWLRGHWPSRRRGALALAGCIVLVPSWWALCQLQQTPVVLVSLLGVIWIADTAAYFSGSLMGRHRFAPVISPGKTWEGVIGALVGVATYVAVLYALQRTQGAQVHGGQWLLLAWAMTALGIEGDLLESWLKRQAQVKDSSLLLPGHGGILDRIDSLTAALPFAALIMAYD